MGLVEADLGSWCACETVPTLVYLTCPTLGSPFSHSLRAICTVLLNPRDPLLQSERMQGFAADPDYWKGEVFAYVGLPQNLKDLKGAGSRAIGLTQTPQQSHPLSPGSRLRKGEVSAYVGSIQHLKDLTRG